MQVPAQPVYFWGKSFRNSSCSERETIMAVGD
jgi:hypothetical protein